MYTFTIILSAIIIIECLEIKVENIVVEYTNPKYGKFIKAGFARTSRRSPYYAYFQFVAYSGFGNNVTVRGSIWERLSGNYQPTPLVHEWKLCDFYNNDPWVGQILAKQFPPNVTCPFPAGFHNFSGYQAFMDHIPYIPFTYDALTVRLRSNMSALLTETKESLCYGAVYFQVTQKPKDSYKKNVEFPNPNT